MPAQGLQLVALNAGGTLYTTLKETLQAEPHSVLAQLVSGKARDCLLDPEGRLFLDVDGEV